MSLIRYYIIESDATTANGIVQTNNSSFLQVYGKNTSYIGDDVFCVSCQSTGTIAPSGARLSTSVNGRRPALNDDLCICKCSPPPKLIHSQTSFKEVIDDGVLARYQAEQARTQSHLTDNATDNDNVLPDLLVHFRRSEHYQGEYGFDWLRDEYIYPLTQMPSHDKEKLLLGRNISTLYQEYREFNNQPIAELGDIAQDTYAPAWLSLCPPSSSMGLSTVSLHLCIEEMEKPLTAGDTVISFECSDGVKLNIDTYRLSALLNQSQQEEISFEQRKDIDFSKPVTNADLQTITKTITHHKTTQPIITITCTHAFSQLGTIKVFAQQGNAKKQVGLLCIYPNQTIKTAVIQPVIIRSNQLSESAFKLPSQQQLDSHIKNHFLNQALIQADVQPYTTLHIDELFANNTTDPVIKNKISEFCQKYGELQEAKEVPDYLSDITRKVPKDMQEEFIQDIAKLYADISKDDPSVRQNITYLFFTDYIANSSDGGVAGTADGSFDSPELIAQCRTNNVCSHWKNTALVFLNIDDINETIHTAMHELGHSFGLAHTFINNKFKIKDDENKFYFEQGYTDNIMDYTHRNIKDSTGEATDNIYDGKMFSLFKWQWEKMRNDINLTKGK